MNRLSFLVFLLFVGISCSNVSDKKLEREINSEIKKTNSLNFSNYKDFQWDSVILLSPYTYIQRVEKENDLNLSGVSKDIEFSDSINLLVFLKDRKMVKYVEINRVLGDFVAEYEVIIPKNDTLIWKLK